MILTRKNTRQNFKGGFFSKGAFTLLELLLVLGITAILFALAFSGYKRLLQSAANTRCLSQLRQVTAGLLAMAADSDNRIQSGFSGNQLETSDIWGWKMANLGYLDKPEVLRCPVGNCSIPITGKTWAWQTYGLNMFGDAGEIRDTTDRPRKVFSLYLSRVVTPASYLLVADSSGISGAERNQSFRIQRETGGVHLRHDGKLNACFADGHAESLPLDRVKELLQSSRVPIYEEE